jgi:hypothetical protein
VTGARSEVYNQHRPHGALGDRTTERAVQKIIAELEEGGFIEREKIGRKNQYRILRNKPLRHSIEQHRTIGALLSLICADD